MHRSCQYACVAAAVGLGGITQAAGQQTCKPTLAFTEVRFSAMQPPTLRRTWTAVLSVDASRCAATSGRFTIGFSRQKEIAPTIAFREQLTWTPGSVTVSVDFWADEAVERYWLGEVAPCACRD